MEALKQNKILLSAFALVSIIFIYFFFFNGSSVPTVLPTSVAGLSGQDDLFNTIQKINRVQIDTSLFSKNSWTSLHDFSVPIPTLTPGKSNIFDPIAGLGGSVQTAPETTTKK